MRPARIPLPVLILGGVVLLAGCASAAGGQDVDLTGGTWRLTEATVDDGPVQVPDDAEVTLLVEDGQASGKAACNTYGAGVATEGTAVTFDQARRTLMACEEPLMTLEDTYLQALARVEAGSRDGDTLELTGQGVRLVFTLT